MQTDKQKTQDLQSPSAEIKLHLKNSVVASMNWYQILQKLECPQKTSTIHPDGHYDMDEHKS